MDSCIQNDPWVRTGMALGIVGCTVGQPVDVRRHRFSTGWAQVTAPSRTNHHQAEQPTKSRTALRT
ncbi:hypothetical protein [Arthrobacter methylotrophus]|uniref:hypothetical protein n=1 Tax=Arthrobacter methylotrophus TaxID=121291 RepID=UPI0031E6D977